MTRHKTRSVIILIVIIIVTFSVAGLLLIVFYKDQTGESDKYMERDDRDDVLGDNMCVYACTVCSLAL